MDRVALGLVATLALVATGCSTRPPALPAPLSGYVGCYALRGIGRRTGDTTWRSLRLTDRPYRDPTGAHLDAFVAGQAQARLYYYWFLSHDTVQVRFRRDLGPILGGGLDTLRLWRTGREFAGYLSETTDMLGSETKWDLVAGRVWCDF